MKSAVRIMFLMTFSGLAAGDRGNLDPIGGHSNRKTGEYHCHREPCLRMRGQTSMPAAYDRKNWGDWQDADADCFDTRAELLAERSETPISSDHCRVRTGKWTGPYTGQIFTNATDLDIDHVVPTKHAYDHGGSRWSPQMKQVFVNDPDNLLIVDDATRTAKNARPPHQWMPPRRDYWCEYLAKWKTVKRKYQLLQSQEEARFVGGIPCRSRRSGNQ